MVQWRAARFVKRDYRRTSSVTSMMSELGWEFLQSRHKVSPLSLFAKALHLAVAVPLDGVVRQNRSTRCTGSDEAPTFQQISTYCNTFKYSFILRTEVDWNQLPSEIWCKSSNMSLWDILSHHFSTNCNLLMSTVAAGSKGCNVPMASSILKFWSCTQCPKISAFPSASNTPNLVCSLWISMKYRTLQCTTLTLLAVTLVRSV